MVTDVGDCAEMLANPGRPAVLPSGSVVRYAESIRLFAANPELRRDMGSKNRARCIAHFSLEQMVSQYGALYRSAIGRQASGTQAISQEMYAGTFDDVSNP
jgi:glycosyltransferase involved in cell wall biosynthesis